MRLTICQKRSGSRSYRESGRGLAGAARRAVFQLAPQRFRAEIGVMTAWSA
jgi:hypothetical protein